MYVSRHCTLHKDGRPDNIKEESSTTNQEKLSFNKSTDSFISRNVQEELL
jgi:hypothetical protein